MERIKIRRATQGRREGERVGESGFGCYVRSRRGFERGGIGSRGDVLILW